MAQNNLTNKVVLITGGTTGIGLAAANQFLQAGAKVVIAGRRQAEGEKAVAELSKISPDIRFIQTDVSKASQVHQLVQQTLELFGRLDIAFNNAGIEGAFGPIDNATEQQFDEIMDINLKGVWLSCKYEIEAFKKQGIPGSIVNTSSWLAVGALAGTSMYSASKAALDGMIRVLAVEVADAGIRINNVNPGYIDTPMFRRIIPDEAAMEPFKQHTPLKRMGKPEDIAALVVWLSSPAASFVTGQSILSDGGLAIGGQRW